MVESPISQINQCNKSNESVNCFQKDNVLNWFADNLLSVLQNMFCTCKDKSILEERGRCCLLTFSPFLFLELIKTATCLV